MKDLKDTLLEAVKEALRVVLLAVFPVLIASIEKGEIEWRAIGIVAVLALLRAADKGLHKWGKVNKDEGMTKGFTRF